MRSVFLLLLCAAPARSDDVESLLAALARGTSAERRETVASLAAQGARIRPQIRAVLLEDKDKLRRAAAADVVGAMGSAGVPLLPALLDAVFDAQPEPRLAALRAIGILGLAARAARPTLETVVVRREGAERDLAMAALLSVARDDANVLRHCLHEAGAARQRVRTLSRLGPEGDEALAALARSPSQLVRRHTLEALRPRRKETWTAAAVRILEERAARDESDRIVQIAAEGLASARAEASIPFARRHLAHRHAAVRAACCAILGSHPPRDQGRDAVRGRLRDPSPSVRASAIAALRAWGVRDAALLDELAGYELRADSTERLQAALLLAAAGCRPAWALAAVAEQAVVEMSVPDNLGLWRRNLRAPGRTGPGPYAKSERSPREVLAAAGDKAVPHIVKWADERPFRTIRLLLEFGEAGQAAIEAQLKTKYYGARAFALHALITSGDRRLAFVAPLIETLHQAARDGVYHYGLWAEAIEHLGIEAAPKLVDEMRKRRWTSFDGKKQLDDPDGGFYAAAEALAALGPRIEKIVGPPETDELAFLVHQQRN